MYEARLRVSRDTYIVWTVDCAWCSLTTAQRPEAHPNSTPSPIQHLYHVWDNLYTTLTRNTRLCRPPRQRHVASLFVGVSCNLSQDMLKPEDKEEETEKEKKEGTLCL